MGGSETRIVRKNKKNKKKKKKKERRRRRVIIFQNALDPVRMRHIQDQANETTTKHDDIAEEGRAIGDERKKGIGA